jgi:NAD(P)-dependent dehydrogenase (short-subunit alcohol dehydrogenase family)
MGRLQDRVVVITGAGSGIGRATALLFGAEGARLVLADINADAAARTAHEVELAGGAAVSQRSDVSREADVQALIERATGAFGRLDVIFNNAGIEGPSARLADHTLEQWQHHQHRLGGGTRRLAWRLRLQRREGGGREPDPHRRARIREARPAHQLHLPRRDPDRHGGAHHGRHGSGDGAAAPDAADAADRPARGYRPHGPLPRFR